MTKEHVCYETVAPNGSIYRYEYTGKFVGIYVNGDYWGSPQGDRFIYALLMDILKLKENEK